VNLAQRLLIPALATAALLALPAAAGAQTCTHAAATADSASRGEMRHAVHCLLNAIRTRHGLAPVARSQRLELAAQRHSHDMVARHYFSHVSPGGSTLEQRVRRTGYARDARDSSLGENIGWASGKGAGAKSLVDAWMDSPPHRAIILNARFDEIGVGISRGVPDATLDEGATAVLDFGLAR